MSGPVPASWSSEDRLTVADLLLAGKSAAEIGAALKPKLSRSAVIGRIHRDKDLLEIANKAGRFGQVQPQAIGSIAASQAPKRVAKAVVTNITNKRESRKNDPVLLLPARTPPLGPYQCRAVELTQLDRHECRWAVNEAPEGEPHLFCGNPARMVREDGVAIPYCQHHHRLAVSRRVQPGERAA